MPDLLETQRLARGRRRLLPPVDPRARALIAVLLAAAPFVV